MNLRHRGYLTEFDKRSGWKVAAPLVARIEASLKRHFLKAGIKFKKDTTDIFPAWDVRFNGWEDMEKISLHYDTDRDNFAVYFTEHGKSNGIHSLTVKEVIAAISRFFMFEEI
jgi:hypothetical protein